MKGFGVEYSFKNKNVESSVDHKMKTSSRNDSMRFFLFNFHIL